MLPYNISHSTLWIVVGFLLVTLLLGLYAGRNVKNFKDYVLGGRRFSSFSLVLTFLATLVGGESIIGKTSEVYKMGMISALTWFAVALQFFFIGLFFSKKLFVHRNNYTLGSLMGVFYGKKAIIITGLLISVRTSFSISVQLIMLGRILNFFFNINPYWGIIIGGSILGIYSILGGIKSVTFTDIFQFIVLIIAIPIITTFMLKSIGSYKDLFKSVQKSKLSIFDNKHFNYWSLYSIYFISFFGFLLNPTFTQRICMSNSSKQIRNQFYTLSVFCIVFGILFTVIGLSMSVLFPNMNSKTVIFHAIDNLYFSNVVKGVIISGFLAVIMSTADSYLHSVGLGIFCDVIKPIFKFSNKKEHHLTIVRLTTFFLVVFSIISALYLFETSYFRNIYTYSAFIVMPTLCFPLVIGILGLKTDKKSFVIGIVSGIIVSISHNYYFTNLKIASIIVGILANAIAYMTSHILQNKGIAWVKREEAKDGKKEETSIWIPSPKKIFNSIINLIPTPKKILNYSKHQVMKNGSQNMIFGIYACINFTLPYFLWDHPETDKFNLMTNLRFIGGIMAGLLIVKDQWKEFLKPYFPLYWHITLTYCLPFITTVMFLLSGGSTSWLMNIGISIFFLIMLVAGEMFLILAPIGVGLALLFYKYYIGPINISSLGFDINYLLFYQIFFPTIIGLLFAYRKKIFNVIRGNIGVNLGLSLCHELRNTLYSLTYTQSSRQKLEMIEKEGTKTIDGEEVYLVSKRMHKSMHDSMDIAIGFNEDTIKVIGTFEKIFLDFRASMSNPKVYSMKSVVEYTLRELHFLPGQKEKVEIDLRDDFYAKVPRPALAFVISNIIRNSFKHGRPTKVKIKLENHKLIVIDDGIGVPSSDLEKIFKMHYTTGKKGESTGIGLGFAKILVNSFQGEIWCESEEGKNSFTEMHIQFPTMDPSEITTDSLKEIQGESLEKGKKEEKEKTAIKMLKNGKSTKEISEYTDLSRSEIEEIYNKLKEKKSKKS